MIKPTLEHQQLRTAPPVLNEIEPAQRLIVPILDPEADLTAITQRVWNLAETLGANIKLIGICQDAADESRMRRTLITMAAMVNYANITADIEIALGKDWIQTVRSECQASDMIVCWDDVHVGPLRKPLSQILQRELDVPIYVLSQKPPKPGPRSNLAFQVAAWIGFATIIIGFLFLQVKIYQLANEWTITFELLSTAVEFWLIGLWNNKFG